MSFWLSVIYTTFHYQDVINNTLKDLTNMQIFMALQILTHFPLRYVAVI